MQKFSSSKPKQLSLFDNNDRRDNNSIKVINIKEYNLRKIEDKLDSLSDHLI